MQALFSSDIKFLFGNKVCGESLILHPQLTQTHASAKHTVFDYFNLISLGRTIHGVNLEA